MGLMLKYQRLKEAVVPDGIRKPFTFFRCLYALDADEWKSAEKVAIEVGVPTNTVVHYLRIAYEHGMAERKRVPASASYGGKRVYVYRLNRSRLRGMGVIMW